MSGGSFEYLCFKDARELLDNQETLEKMSTFLAGLGYAKDAARETEELICLLRQYQNRIQARIDRLHGVWQGAEWWESGDSSEDGFKEDLAKYRGEDVK